VASPLGRDPDVPTDRQGRVAVAPDLRVPGHPTVFVAGDLAAYPGPEGRPLPCVCQVGMQGGKAAASNVARALRGEATRPFRYRDLGSMATIGRASAVATILGVRFSGPLAWLAWLTIHTST
jgi:NADH dehydrogenase